MNRFKHLAQSYIEDNKDILTLPQENGSSSVENESIENTTIPEPTNQDDGAPQPNVGWDFNSPADPTNFNDDVDALIEHLAELETPLSVIEEAVKRIKGPESNPDLETQQPATTEESAI